MNEARFTFQNDPDHGDVLVSVQDMVMTDADGNAALVNPRTPLSAMPEASRRVCVAVLLAMVATAETEGVVKVSYTAEDADAVAATEAATAAEVAAAAEGGTDATTDSTTDGGTVSEGDSTETGAGTDADTTASDADSAPQVVEATEGTIAPSIDELRAALDAVGVKYDSRAGIPRLTAMLAEAQKTAE